jgi:hypothetical protein
MEMRGAVQPWTINSFAADGRSLLTFGILVLGFLANQIPKVTEKQDIERLVFDKRHEETFGFVSRPTAALTLLSS